MNDEDVNTVMVFRVYDYLTLGLMLCISVLIGLYSAIFKKDDTVEAYLFGNRKLKVLPVAASIMASEISSMSILTYPTEVYLYGSNMYYVAITKVVGGIIVYVVILPVFHNLQVATVYEYLEKRFSRSVRTLCSFFFTLQTVLTMAVLMCVTSHSLSLVTGFDFYAVTIITGAVTSFYTAIGGIRAVVWADAVQTLFMFVGVIAIAVKGIIDAGSFAALWNKNLESHRLEAPNFRLDLNEKYGFWELMIGASLTWVLHGGLSQGIVQRYLSVPNLSSARKCLVSSKIFAVVYNIICIIIGMAIVAKFADCDPLQSGKIRERDQMASFYIMQSLKNVSGLPGLTIAAVISAAISTVSTQMNSIAAVVLNDYYKTFINRNVSEKTSNIVLKLTVVILGIMVTLVSFFVKVFGSAYQAYIVFTGAVGGLILGTYAIGVFLPVIKSMPTVLGGVTGFVVMVWIATGMNLAVVSGRLRAITRPLSVEGCERNITITKMIHNNEEVFILYRISSVWYIFIGMVVTVTVSCLLSIFMERNDASKMDRKLFTPLIYRWLPKRSPVSDTEMSLLQNRKEAN